LSAKKEKKRAQKSGRERKVAPFRNAEEMVKEKRQRRSDVFLGRKGRKISMMEEIPSGT